MGYGDEPFHPIVDRPWEYQIEFFAFYVDQDDWRQSYIELHLRKDSVVRRLRFTSPKDLEVERGCFPYPTRGMCFVDVSQRQWENVSIWVTDFEGSHGAIRFFAKSVLDLDSEKSI